MSIVLETIIKANKITDYLLSKNVRWSNHDGGRYRYRCPLPSHSNDSTPSFFVYDKSDRQDFYCYGCKNAGSIIQLISCYEQISIKEVIRRLSEGMNININDILESLVREIIVKSTSPTQQGKEEAILASSLFISVHMHDFLAKVGFDPQECEIAEKVFAITDSLVSIDNLDELEKLSTVLPSKTKFRYQRYIEIKKKEEIQNAKDFKSYINEF
jgi:DNA primase